MTAEMEGISAVPYPVHADLAGTTVFITGGGSGIGAWLVDAFTAQGAQVAFVSLSAGNGEAFCAAVERHRGRRPWFRPCDVRDVDALGAHLKGAAAELGPIRVLINNAARDDRHTLQGMTVAAWDDSLNTNLRPYFFAAQAVAEGMRAGGGSIINVGSNSANLGLAGYPAYVTAKAGIVGLTRALARELGQHDIRVNALIPGWVMTERQKARWVTPEALAECLAQQCLPHPIQGSDIAHAALFLASRAAAAVTGQSLIVDAGRAML
jgi:NAD(P)-dependent dehydrogenase (short-subunit alcohol dehydrogenase family)